MSLYIKISNYFTTNKITAGFFIAFLMAGAIYLDWFGLVNYLLNTILAILALFFLLVSDKKVWLWTGFWSGILWFWWMAVSFINYDMAWAIPISLLISGSVYGLIFFTGINFIYLLEEKLKIHSLLGKTVFLLILSYIHPFGFDWYKPELMLTNTYLGVEKWQYLIVLLSISLAIYKKNIFYFLFIVLAYPYGQHFQETSLLNKEIMLHGTNTSVKDKWDNNLKQEHIQEIFRGIKSAINQEKKVIIFPESVFALFLNRQPKLMSALLDYSKKITIVLGGLSWEKEIPRNSSYIFKNGTVTIANKVKLVPFGEENPLPSWMGEWINDIFFDGAPDYTPAKDFTDYTINGIRYRNAICFEATSEKLYEGEPKNMIVLSNNGWITPSIEPIEQKILLQYYSKKYGTTIYHVVNMSPSYIIHRGKFIPSP